MEGVDEAVLFRQLFAGSGGCWHLCIDSLCAGKTEPYTYMNASDALVSPHLGRPPLCKAFWSASPVRTCDMYLECKVSGMSDFLFQAGRLRSLEVFASKHVISCSTTSDLHGLL